MTALNKPKTSEDKNKISTRFRNVNIVLFMLVSILIVAALVMVLRNITDAVSKDYARLYSTNTSSALSAHLNKEIAIVGKAARSKAVIDWFEDEFNQEKKDAALKEILEIIDALYSDNMYLAIDSSLNEYTVEKQFTISDSALKRDYYDDAWYFECLDSENDYVLNVDVDKILHRKLVWVNYKVINNGVPVGIICSGLDFANTAESQLAEYDNTKVRGVIIDEHGVVQMDSVSLGEDNFLRYEQFYQVEDEFSDPAFLGALEKHLGGIDGFYRSYDPVIVELSGNPYNYATIAPIQATNWSVITFYDSSSLFNMVKLVPLFIVMLVMLIGYALITGSISYRLLFKPIELLVSSLAKTNENKDERIYGTNRRDEIGELSQNIQNMKNRLDSYSSDLEKEVEERSAELRLAYDQTKEQNQIILSSIDYASKIQMNLLPADEDFKKAFSDYSVIWKPRDVVGGDIYWLKNFDEGSVLCVCDCTGHGTPGALLTMLVVSALENIVNKNNYKDTAYIIWELDQRLVDILNARANSEIKDGCDLAVLFIAKDGQITLSSGKTHVFICDGKKVTQIKGQRLYIGEGRLKSKDEIITETIPKNPNNKFYIASDGLFDQKGGKQNIPFGYKIFKELILKNHYEQQAVISGIIWETFENYRGEGIRLDDFELITFML